MVVGPPSSISFLGLMYVRIAVEPLLLMSCCEGLGGMTVSGWMIGGGWTIGGG